MLKAVDGMDVLVSELDGVIRARPGLPSLVVVVTSADPELNTGFLEGIGARLTDVGGRDLVPHAYASREIAESAARGGSSPDARLLDLLVRELKGSIPRGSGKNWKTRQFRLVQDVVEVGSKIDGKASEATREAELLSLLYERWEKRNPLLSWARGMSGTDLPVPLIGTVLAAILSGPSKWLFTRRLDGGSTRWLREQVRSTSGRPGGFTSQALLLLPAGGLDNLDDLRRRVLVGAILEDVAELVRRGRVSPSRRRRRWTPVLLLDGAHPLTAVLLDQFAGQLKNLRSAPLLVVGTLAPEHAARVAKTTPDVPNAAITLSRFVKGEPEVLSDPPYLVVRLPEDEKTNPAVETWLGANRRVTPKVPGLSAFVPLALVVALLAGAAGIGAYRYLMGGCSETKVNASGERVGVIVDGCSFVSGKTGFGEGVPDLGELERQVAENNKVVDRLKDRQGNPRYYRTVVFFGPLTRADQAESTAPPNAIWQLKGVVRKQEEHNRLADSDDEKVPVKLVLANSGDRFADGRWVAERIAALKRAGRGELAAVIGISQSRPEALEAVAGLKAIPVIGAAMYGSEMAKNRNMFLSSPFNAAFAEKISEWAAERDVRGTAVVYDPDDPYFSKELHAELNARHIGSAEKDVVAKESPESGMGEPSLKKEDVARLCAEADTVVPVIASRGDQLLKLLSIGADLKACSDRRDNPIRLVSGPGGVVVAASGVLTRYPWVRVWVTGLATTAEQSELTAGFNAFGMATQAISETHQKTTQFPDWDVSQVLVCLAQPTFGYNGVKPNVPGLGEGRVHMIEPLG